MSRSLRTVLFLSALAFLSSCDSTDPSQNSELSPYATPLTGASGSDDACTVLNGFKVCLVDAVVEAGATTFEYKVSPEGAVAHLERLVIGFETCDPVVEVAETVPTGAAVELDDEVGIGGVLFAQTQLKTEEKVYTITFSGELFTGPVPAGIFNGTTAETGTVPGAVCEPPRYDLSGSVYVESDESNLSVYGTREDSESGLGEVTVQLLNTDGTPVLSEEGEPLETKTDADGAFLFEAVVTGDYVVVVPKSTADASDLNETLYLVENGTALYAFVHPEAIVLDGDQPAVPVALTADKHIDVGFAPVAQAFVQALDGPLATQNRLPFDHFLPLLAGLSAPDQIATGTVPLYSVPFGAYQLGFLGRAYDPVKDQTTYTYHLKRVAKKGHDVSHAVFSIDTCAPVAYLPKKKIEIGRDPTTGLTGVKFDFEVKQEQTYQLVYRGDVNPGVIQVGVKHARDISIIPMPGACGESMGSVDELLEALSRIFYGGPSDTDFLFLKDPLVLPSGMSELAAAIELLLDRDVEVNSLQYLRQYLLAAQIIYVRGLGTPNPDVDKTIFQFVEPIILFESQNPTTSKTFGPTAGTGGRGAGGSVLGGYVSF